jgi:hypothetical protein
MSGLFEKSFVRVATLDKAENGFIACENSPFNLHVFSPEHFCPAKVSFVPNTAEKENTRSGCNPIRS